MSQVISGFDFCFAYLDDILVYSTSWKEHLQHFEMVFKCVKEANLKIKLSKCQFFKKYLYYLGHLISEQGVQPFPEKVSGIKKLKKLCNIDDLHQFLSLMGYYRKFIPLFTDVTKPLNKVLKKDIKFQWSLQCQAAFKHLKQALCSILLEKNHIHCLLTQVIIHIPESSPRQLKFLRI